MGFVFSLPPNTPQGNRELEDIMHNLTLQGISRRRPEEVKWWLSNYYMRGIRNFSDLDYATGPVNISYMDEQGVLKFKYEEIVGKYQAQLGRLLSLDLSPAVTRKGISLDGMRKASVAQVVLDSAMPQEKVDKLKLDICPPLLMYGTVGAGLWVEGPDSQGIDIISPWELLPIPTDISGPTDVRGLIRSRFVPVDWVKGLTISPGDKSKIYKGVTDVRIPVGDLPADLTSNYSGQAMFATSGSGFFVRDGKKGVADEEYGAAGKKKKDQAYMDVTRLTEVWMETSDGYLGEYIGFVGMDKFKKIFRFDHSQEKYHMPVQVIRDTTVGSFWGRSFVDLLMPLNQEVEYALSNIFQGVADFDLYGLQLWPASLGVPPEAQRGQDGLKRVVYEPDYTSPDMKPENIMPAKMTKPQLDAVSLAVSLMGRLANQPEEMMRGEAPGRTDSSVGFGMLMETSSIPLSPTAKNLANGIAGVYRAMLRVLKDMWTDQKVVSISNLDDALAGIILDTKTGTLSLSQNAIPYPDEVMISVASEVPVSKEQQKGELKDARERNIIDLEEYGIQVRKLGLNLPVGGEVAFQNYRRAMYENIILFGDGQKPGEIIVSERDMHMVHKKVMDAFMARPEFYEASVPVRDAFERHWQEHQNGLAILPEGIGPPDEEAEAYMAEQEMMGGPEGGMSPQI